MSTNRQTHLDAASIKGAVLGFLKQSANSLLALRDKEWVSDEIDRLENQGRLTSQKGASQIKPTGIVRNVDELGRVVIPKELRTAYGIGPLDPVEIYVDPVTKFVVLKKYQKQCHFCGGSKDITVFKNKYICENCVGEFSEQVLG